ncbi:hypothetical protein J1614_002680 [Plenodomus biglobosus]|nr:hypothetical protein J1614_002680 [Plenodomus biglobosus]
MAASALNEERELAIHPIVATSVQHNTQVVSNIRNLTASLFGVAAGTLGLESYTGFIFYLLGSLFVSALLFSLKTNGKPGAYFYKPFGDMWLGDVFGGLSGFVLTWTLFYGLRLRHMTNETTLTILPYHKNARGTPRSSSTAQKGRRCNQRPRSGLQLRLQ